MLAAVASHSDRRFRWPSTILAAAAAVAVGLAAVGVELALRPAIAPSIAAQVFAAPDVRTTCEPIPTGSTATVVYSHEKNARDLDLSTPVQGGGVGWDGLVVVDEGKAICGGFAGRA